MSGQTPPRTLGELAQSVVDAARADLAVAEERLRGAVERQRLIAERGKSAQPLRGFLDGVTRT